MASQRRPLLEEEEPDFISYDDDDLHASYRLRKKRQRIRAGLWITAGVVIIILVGVGLYFGTNGIKTSGSGKKPSSPLLGKYKNAAVASDVTQCSQIGRDIMENSGGNAVDAALASLLCMGLADPQSMGIGGGFFMTIYNSTTNTSSTIDARETAPAAATKDMFNTTSSTEGGLAIAVPGEIRGYQMAFENHGSLTWKQIFQPAIDMAQNGFTVPKSLEDALQSFVDSHNERKYQQFYTTYINQATGKIYKAGELLKLPLMARTLSTIAKEGADSFYNGSLTNDILQDMGQNNSGAIITVEDLHNYKALAETALSVMFRDGMKIYGPNAPSSGAILMFILNILEGYNITPNDVHTTEGKTLTYHRIIEAFKFAYAKRTNLGDYANVTALIRNLTSKDYADNIRVQIWDNQTHPVDYYGPTFYHDNKTSTAHLSVVDQFGNAVSVTSTVNLRFGSKVIGAKTGIIFNDEMDDFATSDKPNDFGLYPSPANQIAGGKRPLSSMCPAIFVDGEGVVQMVVGAAGGSRITTATAYVAARVLWFGENIQTAINALRLHHQLLPDEVSYEAGFDQEVIDGLKAKGHNVTQVGLGKSIVQGIHRNGDLLWANSDFRKGGTPDGY